MNFIRYGIDHYIPGDEASQSLINAGNGYDNNSYYGNETQYQAALAKMKVHLKTIDPNFSDTNIALIKSIWNTVSDILETKDNPEKLQKTQVNVDTNKFVQEFILNVSGWMGLTREKYSANNYGSIEGALSDCMEIIFDRSQAQIEEFVNRLKSITDKVGWFDFVKLFYGTFISNKWYDMSDADRAMYTTKILEWLKGTKCFDALELKPAELNNFVNTDMRVSIDFFMNFLSNDYVRNLYETNGCTQILTLINHITQIGQNHSPNVAMAWVRVQDSFYDNETSQVRASSEEYLLSTANLRAKTASNNDIREAVSREYSLTTANMRAGAAINNNVRKAANEEYLANVRPSAEGEQVLFDLGEIDDIVSDHVQDVEALLSTRTSVMVEYESGAVEELPITWNTEDYASYYYNKHVHENSEVWIEYNEAANEVPEDLTAPRLYYFRGNVNLPANVTNPNNVSTEIILQMYVDGLPQMEEPEAYPPEGEFYGSMKVYLVNDENEGAEIYYWLTEKGIGAEPEKYTGPITLELEEGATDDQDYYLIAYTKSNEPDYADSDVMIWHYIIHPIDANNAVADDGTYKYSLGKGFSFSKDTPVCWRIDNDNITLANSSAIDADTEPEDLIFFFVNSASSDVVPINKIDVAVTTIADVTLAGVYSLPLQISTDGGTTWTDETTITFNTSKLVEAYIG